MWRRAAGSASRSVRALGVSARTERTTAFCQRSVARWVVPCGVVLIASVALVPLFLPRVAAVVVAVALPEPGLVVVEQAQPGDPLGALPEVQVRDQQAGGSAVLDGQRLALVLPHHPRLAAGDVGERQVRRVARVRPGDDVR